MFKKFIEEIILAKDHEDAVNNVFYGTVWEDGHIKKYGIDMAYQHDLLSRKEFEMLSALIEKIA